MGFWVGFNTRNTSKSGLFCKKWGSIQENPQKQDFSYYLGLYSRVGLQYPGYGMLHVSEIPGALSDNTSFYVWNYIANCRCFLIMILTPLRIHTLSHCCRCQTHGCDVVNLCSILLYIFKLIFYWWNINTYVNILKILHNVTNVPRFWLYLLAII